VTDSLETTPSADALRANGPLDESEATFEGVNRIDLGGLLLAIPPEVEIQVQADQASGRITQLTLKDGNSGMQIHPYAARKSGGMWQEVRTQIIKSINEAGGLVEEVQGDWGTELNAQIQAQGENPGLQPARFVGIDGPRWFLRAVFLGQGARDKAAAQRLTDCLRSAVVVRGNAAMAPGAPLVLTLPKQAEKLPDNSARQIPNPFERGPELTEIR
jgi:hypothetical protein